MNLHWEVYSQGVWYFGRRSRRRTGRYILVHSYPSYLRSIEIHTPALYWAYLLHFNRIFAVEAAVFQPNGAWSACELYSYSRLHEVKHKDHQPAKTIHSKFQRRNRSTASMSMLPAISMAGPSDLFNESECVSLPFFIRQPPHFNGFEQMWPYKKSRGPQTAISGSRIYCWGRSWNTKARLASYGGLPTALGSYLGAQLA